MALGKASKFIKALGILIGLGILGIILTAALAPPCGSNAYSIGDGLCCPNGKTCNPPSGSSSTGSSTNCGGYGKIYASAPSYLYDVVVHVDGSPLGVPGKSIAVPAGHHKVYMGGYTAANNWIESMTWNIYTDSCTPSTIKWN